MSHLSLPTPPDGAQADLVSYVPYGADPSGSPARALRKEQVRLFCQWTRMLRRLARQIDWREIRPPERRWLASHLRALESDLTLVRQVALSNAAVSSHTKKAARNQR
jgi:hypothetical protein